MREIKERPRCRKVILMQGLSLLIENGGWETHMFAPRWHAW